MRFGLRSLGIKILASNVHADEPCWSLFEGPRVIPMPDGSQQRRWVQAVYIIRGDAIAEWTQDLGPEEFFERSTLLMIPSFGENTVAQLQDLAERSRHDDKWYRRREELKAESTLIADILRQEEIKLSVMANRSTFGPAISVERTAYPAQAASRQLMNGIKERRANARRSRA